MENKTTFIFIRHGQGTHNVDFKKYGEHAYFDEKNVNAKLTEFGRLQAQDVYKSGKLGNANNYDILFCSPLTRCIDTLLLAVPDSSCVSVLLDDRLMEPQGDCACNKRLEYSELQNNIPEKWDMSGVAYINPFNHLREGYQLGLSGNSVFLKRILNWGEEVLNLYRGRKILVCAHHDWIRGWFQIFQGGRLVSPDNCEILHAMV
jgi:broad specificity phosphatase PhoE